MTERKGEGVYNAVVIGAGTAGLVTAAGLAGFGARVALIERNKMGGDCLDTGCVPSKALISSARLAAQIRRAPDWGLAPQEPRIDFEKVFARMRERRAEIAPHDSQERFESLGVDVFRGEASFVSPDELDVEGLRLHARNFVIASGSRPRVPRIEGLKDAPFYTNETVFDRLERKPARLVILGGGPIGCELGQMFARLGVETTIVQSARRILEKEDEDASDFVRRSLESDRVGILTGSETQMVTRNDHILRLWVQTDGGERQPIDCDALLVAIGRAPNVESLGLPKAGVAFTAKGVTVNEYLQTSQPHIYAAGDVIGKHYFTHVADAHARIVVRNILVAAFRAKMDNSVVPWCTFTDPELARVGLSEQDARAKGIGYDVWCQSFADLDRAVVESEARGFVKVLTRRGGDRILGVTLAAGRAGDLIHEFVLAMKAGVGLKTISSTIHAYPTFAEIARKVADRQQRSRLTPLVRRLAEWSLARRRS